MNQELQVAFGESRLAAAFVIGSGVATLALLFAMPLAPLLHALVSLWLGAEMLDAYRIVALRLGPRGVREVGIVGDGLRVVDAVGGVRAGELRAGSFVSPGLTLIRWRPHGARRDRTIVVLPDMLPAEDFRALRVALRFA